MASAVSATIGTELIARILSQVRDRLQAVHPWHLNVHQDKGWVDFLCFCDGFQPIVSDHHYPSQTK